MTMHCMSGMCGSLGSIAAMGQLPGLARRRIPARGVGQETTYDAPWYTGRGCSRQGVPPSDELQLLQGIRNLEHEEYLQAQDCPEGPGKPFCLAEVAEGYAPRVRALKSEFTGVCLAKGYPGPPGYPPPPAPPPPPPLPDYPPPPPPGPVDDRGPADEPQITEDAPTFPEDNTVKYLAVGGILLLVLGGGGYLVYRSVK